MPNEEARVDRAKSVDRDHGSAANAWSASATPEPGGTPTPRHDGITTHMAAYGIANPSEAERAAFGRGMQDWTQPGQPTPEIVSNWIGRNREANEARSPSVRSNNEPRSPSPPPSVEAQQESKRETPPPNREVSAQRDAGQVSREQTPDSVPPSDMSDTHANMFFFGHREFDKATVNAFKAFIEEQPQQPTPDKVQRYMDARGGPAAFQTDVRERSPEAHATSSNAAPSLEPRGEKRGREQSRESDHEDSPPVKRTRVEERSRERSENLGR